MSIRIDPQHPGSVLRFFLIAETIINLIEGIIFFFYPAYFLRMLVPEGYPIDALHENLLRVFALVLTFVVTSLTAISAMNTKMGFDTRKPLYIAYALVEGVGISFFWWCSIVGPEKSGFDPESIKFVAKQLIVPFFGRLVPLLRPEFFGKYVIVEEGSKKTR